MISKIWGKLNDPEYRKAFVSSQINIGIPFQIRALLKGRGKTQEWLAEKAGMLQPRISGLMTPGKTRPNIETLRRIAEALDCGLVVRFAPFSEMVKWSEEFDPEEFSVPSFGSDSAPMDYAASSKLWESLFREVEVSTDWKTVSLALNQTANISQLDPTCPIPKKDPHMATVPVPNQAWPTPAYGIHAEVSTFGIAEGR
jgi:transcriptional regulator with XRE-family HTH domain